MNMKHAEFEERVRKLDAKFTDKDGNRDKVLAEIVDKLKEHVRLYDVLSYLLSSLILVLERTR